MGYNVIHRVYIYTYIYIPRTRQGGARQGIGVSDFNYDIGPTVKAAAAAGRKSSLYYPPNVVNNGLGAHLEHRKADHLEHQVT